MIRYTVFRYFCTLEQFYINMKVRLLGNDYKLLDRVCTKVDSNFNRHGRYLSGLKLMTLSVAGILPIISVRYVHKAK